MAAFLPYLHSSSTNGMRAGVLRCPAPTLSDCGKIRKLRTRAPNSSRQTSYPLTRRLISDLGLAHTNPADQHRGWCCLRWRWCRCCGRLGCRTERSKGVTKLIGEVWSEHDSSAENVVDHGLHVPHPDLRTDNRGVQTDVTESEE